MVSEESRATRNRSRSSAAWAVAENGDDGLERAQWKQWSEPRPLAQLWPAIAQWAAGRVEVDGTATLSDRLMFESALDLRVPTRQEPSRPGFRLTFGRQLMLTDPRSRLLALLHIDIVVAFPVIDEARRAIASFRFPGYGTLDSFWHGDGVDPQTWAAHVQDTVGYRIASTREPFAVTIASRTTRSRKPG
jgi:hypothetical protein